MDSESILRFVVKYCRKSLSGIIKEQKKVKVKKLTKIKETQDKKNAEIQNESKIKKRKNENSKIKSTKDKIERKKSVILIEMVKKVLEDHN